MSAAEASGAAASARDRAAPAPRAVITLRARVRRIEKKVDRLTLLMAAGMVLGIFQGAVTLLGSEGARRTLAAAFSPWGSL